MSGAYLSSVKSLFSRYAILDVNFPVAEKYQILGTPELYEPDDFTRARALRNAKGDLELMFNSNNYNSFVYLYNTKDSHYADYLNSISLDLPSLSVEIPAWIDDMNAEQSLSALAITFKYTSKDNQAKPIPTGYPRSQSPRQYTGPRTNLPPDSRDDNQK